MKKIICILVIYFFIIVWVYASEINYDTDVLEEQKDMITTFKFKLKEKLNLLEWELKDLSNAVPTDIYEKIDSRLNKLFMFLEEELWNSERYLKVLNAITDKVGDLQNSWEITNDTLIYSLDIININTEIKKNLLMQDNIDIFSSLDIEEITSNSLETLKTMFDSLNIEY